MLDTKDSWETWAMFDLSVRVGGTNLRTWRAQVVKQSNSHTHITHTHTHKILRHKNKNGNKQNCLHSHTFMPINACRLAWNYTNRKKYAHTHTHIHYKEHTEAHTCMSAAGWIAMERGVVLLGQIKTRWIRFPAPVSLSCLSPSFWCVSGTRPASVMGHLLKKST